MFFDGAYFANNMSLLLSAAWLCLYPVKDSLKIPLSKVLPAIFVFTTLFCLALSLVDADLIAATVPFYIAACFLVYRRIVRADWRKLLFITFVVTSYSCFCGALAATFQVPLSESDLRGEPEQYFNAYRLLYCMGVLSVSVTPVTLLLKRKVWPAIRDLEAGEWSYLWIIPLIYSATSVVIQYTMRHDLLYSWQFRSAILLLSVGAFVSYYLIVHMMQKTAQSAREVERARMIEAQLELQSEQYERIQDGIAEARKSRHDLRQSLAALSGLLRQGKLDELNAYLSQMLVQLPTESDDMVCKNHVVNAVVRHYLALAAAAGIRVSTRLDIPEDTGDVPQIDLCVLIGNMLENALEACRRMPNGGGFIRLLASIDGVHLTISMENSFDGICRMKDGAFLSRKRVGEGIGLSSIRAIAEKHYGYATISADGGKFDTSIVLRMSR